MANNSWLKLLADLVQNYEYKVAPRNIEAFEILNYSSIINMNYPIVTVAERKLNYKFMFGEAWWILSGSNRVDDISQYLSHMGQYSDNGITFRGAYGPKVTEQLDYVVDCLTKDMYSRQALLTIWRENPRTSKDIPCTLSLQFLIRDKKLHCVANMRSSDAWVGWVYDIFNFSMISVWIAIAFKRETGIPLDLGYLHLNAASQHLYNKDYDSAANLVLKAKNGISDVVVHQKESHEAINLDWYEHPDHFLRDLKIAANQANSANLFSMDIFR